MDEAAKKTHDDLQQLILRRDAIESQMQQEDLGDEERGPPFITHHSTFITLAASLPCNAKVSGIRC